MASELGEHGQDFFFVSIYKKNLISELDDINSYRTYNQINMIGMYVVPFYSFELLR